MPITNDAPAVFPLGDTVVTWTATDASGNVGVATAAVASPPYGPHDDDDDDGDGHHGNGNGKGK